MAILTLWVALADPAVAQQHEGHHRERSDGQWERHMVEDTFRRNDEMQQLDQILRQQREDYDRERGIFNRQQ